ncbi:dihydroxy-acid dehydratase [Loktanella agnita]|uniref:dihydroxy-acid dehydratase n=1 Tax=Loktanella agnita TaxID=287097 RepID=UPI003988778C
MIRWKGAMTAASLWGLTACMQAEPVQSVALMGGAVTATTPPGYCVDTRASRPGEGFALMAPCATLGVNMPAPSALGVTTVQVGPPDSQTVTATEASLRDMLESEAGAVLLSSDGQPDTVTVLGSQALRNRVTVHFTDEGPPPLPGLQREEWRAFTDIDGRLVTVAVRGLATAPLHDGTGAWLLSLVVQGLTAAAIVET